MGSSGYRPLVLIVDDESTMRLLTRATLEQAGFEVAEATGGSQALKVFKTLAPDLVLMDVMMPEMDGFVTCTELRKLPGGLHTPILMATALEDLDSINRAFEAGATDFITKPLNWTILSYRVRYMVRASQTFAALLRSQRRLAHAQDIARLGYWEWHLEVDRILWSQEIARLFGIQELTGGLAGFLRCIHPEDKARVLRAIDTARDGGHSFNLDTRIILPDSSELIVNMQAEVTMDSNGRPVQITGTIQDVNERKRAEEEIIQQREELRGLAIRLAEVEESERQRLVRALHDEVCQNLAGIALTLGTLKLRAQQEPLDRLLSRLSDAVDLVNQTSEITRSIMEGLRPTVLDHYGLIGGLRQLAGQFIKQTGIDLEVLGEEAPTRQDPTTELAIFRIAQEALANVTKHAKATRVIISKEEKADVVRFVIADNGIGFDQAQVPKPMKGKKWGLITMSERAIAIGGTCYIESQPGQGTRVIMEVSR